MIARIGLTLISGLVLIFPGQIAAKEPVRDLTWFLRRLRTVDHLPELEASHTAMSSTWDRSGGNADGTDFKKLLPATPDTPARNVLFDQPGPGCIHRIFVGRLAKEQAGTRIQVFLDRHDQPVFDMPVLEFFRRRRMVRSPTRWCSTRVTRDCSFRSPSKSTAACSW